MIRCVETSDTNSNAHEVSQNINCHDNDDGDSNADDEYVVLKLVLTFAKSIMGLHVTGLAACVGQNPSLLHISNLIAEVLPLNTKQKCTVSIVFYHVLRHQGKPAVEKDNQFLLYVGGEGGTGKSQIIDTVRLGIKLLE